MAINNFIPQVWSARLMLNLRKNLIFAQPGVVNRDYEGEITQVGDSVRINAIGQVQIGDYTKNTDFQSGPQTLDDASQVLVIDRSRYYNFFVDDVDRIQQQPKIMDAAMGEAAYAMVNDVDGYMAAKWSEAGNSVTGTGGGNIMGTDANPYVIGLGQSDYNAYEVLVDVAVQLDTANCPADGRWAIVPPWFYGLLLKDARFVSFGTDINAGVLRNGIIGGAAGMTILRSNNVSQTNSGQHFKIMAGHPMAITLAIQVTRAEAYRPERRFGDAVKGLALYGAKVIRPSLVTVLTARRGS